MVASGAGLDDGTAQEAQPNGLVLVCGQFDPWAVVELVERKPGEFRSESDREVLNRRTVDEDGMVGFSGLEVAGLYFVKGYSGGRYVEVRAVAQDPALAITGLQKPPPPPPMMIGTAGTAAAAVQPAPPETPTEGTGLDAGATVAVEQGQQEAAPVNAVVQTTAITVAVPCDDKGWGSTTIDGLAVSLNQPEQGTASIKELAVEDGETPKSAIEVDNAPASQTVSVEVSIAVDEAPAMDAEADAAKVAEAPDAATAQASQEPAPDPSAQPAAVPAVDAPPTSTAAAAQPAAAAPAAAAAADSAQPAPGAAVDSAQQSAVVVPVAQAPAVVDQAGDLAKLVAQATVLGLFETSGLGEDELRQAITEKGATPVV